MTKKSKKNLPKKKSENKSKKFSGDLLHKEDKEFVERKNLTESLNKRRARYWCFRFQKEFETENNPDVETRSAYDAPKGFKEFVESLPGFTSWDKFAKSWDIVLVEENSFMIVHRILTVWQEWDHVMDRIAVPVDASPEEISMRVASLTKDFARRFGG